MTNIQSNNDDDNKTHKPVDIGKVNVNIPPEPKDELESLAWQIITDYIGYENQGYTTAQSVESAIAYNIPNLKQLIQSRERAAEKLGAETVIALADARTEHPLAPDHDNYIIKCYMVDAYLQQLTNPQAGEGSEV